MKEILKHTSILVLPKIFRFFIGIIRAKLNAVFLGTEGVGITSQIDFTGLKLSRFVLLGMNDGLVKQIAEKRNLNTIKEEIIFSLKSYFLLIVITSFLSLAILLIFQDTLTNALFGQPQLKQYYYITIIIVPILIIQSTFFAILKAFTASKLIAKTEFISITASFIIFVPAIYFFGIKGAVATILLKFLFMALITFRFANKHYLKPLHISFVEIIKAPLIHNKLKELTLFAGIGLGVGFLQMFAELYNRSLVINKLGIDELGLYTPNIAWGGLFISFVIPAMYTYLYSKFSEIARDNVKLTKMLNDAIRIILTLVIPFLLIGIGYREYLIKWFYSDEFSRAADYLPIHFTGILLIALMETISQIFTPTGRIKTNAIIMTIRFSLQMLILTLFVEKFGLYAYAFIFVIPQFISLSIMFVVLKNKYAFKLKKVNFYLISLAVISIIFTTILTKYGSVLYTTIFVAIILFLLLKSLTKNEMILFKGFLTKKK